MQSSISTRSNSKQILQNKISSDFADSDCSKIIMLDETEIVEVYSTKFLGKNLDQGFTWNCHVDSDFSKLSSDIYVLR